MNTEPRTPDEQREFEIRCHPERATFYDVNFLIAKLDAARTERDALRTALNAALAEQE